MKITIPIVLTRAITLLAVAFGAVVCSAGTDIRGVLGLNRPHLVWYGTVEQETALIDKMIGCGTGMKSVRLGLRYTDAATRADTIAHIKHCNTQGIAVLLQVSVQNSAFYPAGTTQRAGNSRMTATAYRLSELDPNLFETQVTTFLQEAKDAGASILAIQLGNEANWAGYNGDLPVYDDESTDYKILNGDTPWDDQDLVNFRAGLSKYGTCFYRLSHKCNTIFGLNVVKRVTVSTADVPDSWVQSSRSSKATPALLLQLLEGSNPNQSGATNYLTYAHGLGVHIYPANITRTLSITVNEIDTYISSIQNTINSTLPFWITEFGYPRARFNGIPNQEYERFRQHAIFLQALNQLSFPLAYSFLYTFDFSLGYEIYLPATDTYLDTRRVFIDYY